eukprot:5283291-Amphidinium_carterae.1
MITKATQLSEYAARKRQKIDASCRMKAAETVQQLTREKTAQKNNDITGRRTAAHQQLQDLETQLSRVAHERDQSLQQLVNWACTMQNQSSIDRFLAAAFACRQDCHVVL